MAEMKPNGRRVSRVSRVSAYAAGCVLAATWYSSTAALLSGLSGQTVPVLGAIGIAALAPALFSRSQRPPTPALADMSLAQQLGVLKTHTMVNVVDTNNTLIEVNDLLLDATGFSRDELVGQPVAKLYAQAHLGIAEEIRMRLNRRQGWQGETALRRRDGSICMTQTTVTPLLDCDGQWIGSISARTDITKTTQLMAERDTALTMHELRDDIWIVDEQTEAIKYMNRAAMRRLGWSSKNYADVTLTQITQMNDCCRTIQDACAALKAENGEFIQLEGFMFGAKFDISIKRLHPNPNSTDGRFLIMLHDVSDRLARERMQADFISMVSHELRSPLTSIKGSMGLLLSKAAGELSPKAEGLLEIAHRNADRLVLIINDILDMEKISSGRLDFEINDCDASEMVHEALRSNAAVYQRSGLKIRCVGADTRHLIQTDQNRVIQVLINLLSNAAKFSSPGGVIEVKIEDLPAAVRISVRDEGVGIPENEKHKIFQRFADMTNSDRSTKGGTGLGLSICKAIVENLGGTIRFDSVEGIGTTFMFTLPKTVESQTGAAEAAILQVPKLQSVG